MIRAKIVDLISLSDTETQLTVYSIFGKYKAMDISIGIEDFSERYREWLNGELIQKAFDVLSDDEREFIMTGIDSSE